MSKTLYTLGAMETKLARLIRKGVSNLREEQEHHKPQHDFEAVDSGCPQDVDSGVLEIRQVQLQAVKSALERHREGTYGNCVDCGEKIATKRLEALPSAERCVGCQSDFERVIRRNDGQSSSPKPIFYDPEG